MPAVRKASGSSSGVVLFVADFFHPVGSLAVSMMSWTSMV